MKLNWNFLGGGGWCKTKNLAWGEYGYFLELQIIMPMSWLDSLYEVVFIGLL